ncbi:MAG: zinc-binding dehydrogenase [Bacteroidota bacterium]
MTQTQVVLRQFGTEEGLEIVQSPLQSLKAGKIRVRVEASSLTRTDLTIRKGLYPLLKTPPPFVLGYDFVGTVEESAEYPMTVKPGDRVAGICQIGGHSTHIDVAPDQLLKVHSDLPGSQIAPLVLSGMTAYQLLKYCAKLKQGDLFLVHGGSGAVGNILLQLCSAFGIRTISTASKKNLSFINELGAQAIAYDSPNYFEKLKSIAGAGLDAALDFSSQKSINTSFSLLKPKGKLILAGLLATQKKMERKTGWNFLKFGFEFVGMMLKKAIWNRFSNKEVHFFGIVDSKRDFPKRYQQDFDELLAMLSSGKLKIHENIYPLSEARKAHLDLAEGRIKGNAILQMYP